MRKALLLLLIIASVSFGAAKVQPIDEFQQFINGHGNFTPISAVKTGYCKVDKISLKDIKTLLYAHSDTLNVDVIQTVLATIKCAKERDIQNSNVLTIIDFSLPSNQKRLWIFDLQNMELLFHTYVTHGIRSGTLETTYFSNKVNDKTSSLGVFITGDAYYGRHGLSLRLSGLESKFNDRANQRSIVLHAAWYADENFISKYGRVGRSWGCPAVPQELVKPIIDLIKGQSLFIAYYPSSQWFLSSRFLNCPGTTFANSNINLKNIADSAEDDFRGEIIFIDKNNDNKREENEPVLVMSATDYQQIFNMTPPLKRMLRAQINNNEYIALNNEELKNLDSNRDNKINDNDEYGLHRLTFVTPDVIYTRGYYKTQFNFVSLGQIQEIQLLDGKIYRSDNSFVNLGYATDFIRWVGL